MGREEGPRKSGVDWAASGNSELGEQKVHGAVIEWRQRSKLSSPHSLSSHNVRTNMNRNHASG